MQYERKALTPEQIGRLAANERVLYVGERTLVLTLEFRTELYRSWELDPGTATVRAGLVAAGIDERELGFGLAHEIERGFRRSGAPKRSRSPVASVRCTLVVDRGITGWAHPIPLQLPNNTIPIRRFTWQ